MFWLSSIGMSAWLDSVECCYHWMTWPSWNPWIWGRQNTPSAKCIHCGEVSLSHSFPSSGMPCLDLLGHRAMTPAKLKLSPSESDTSMAREELQRSYTEKLFPDLRKYFMEVWTLHYSKNKLAHNLQLLTSQKTLCLLQLVSPCSKATVPQSFLSPWWPRSPSQVQ